MSKNIVLVGLMGCGKTTIGSLLSKLLNRKFVDSDSLITNLAGLSVSQIFEKYGEAYFRELERKVIEDISCQNDLIISTGGGVVENPENIASLKENGVLFYLYASAQDLYDRIKNDDSRPLLKNSDPLATLEKLLARREKFYSLSEEKIQTGQRQVKEIAEEIIEKYARYE